jgi:hypothetical protein
LGKFHLAPEVHRLNISERWYEEDYLNTPPLTDPVWTKDLRTFQTAVSPVLVGMMINFPHQAVRVLEYTLRWNDVMLGTQGKLTDGMLNVVKVDRIRNFANRIIERLQRIGNHEIFLVCSHGDLHQAHIFITKSQTMLIDWEAAGYRSALYDFYDTFFRPIRDGAAALDIVVVKKAIAYLQSCMAGPVADQEPFVQSLDASEVYRLTYYLEKIERICLAIARDRTQERRLDRILRYVDTFERFEERLLLSPIEASRENRQTVSDRTHSAKGTA